MTDQRNDFRNDSHLPECLAHNDRDQSCCCPELRACEERIYSRDIFMDAWKKGYAEAKKKYSEYLNADDEGSYSAGFRDGHEFAKTTLLTFMQQEQFDEMMKALDKDTP